MYLSFRFQRPLVVGARPYSTPSPGWPIARSPTGGLAFNQKGNLYGTTVFGGTGGYGTVFQLQPPVSGGAWTFNVIHNLSGYNNGYPVYPLVVTYGIVYFEEPGGGSLGLGAVSQLSPPATTGGAWLYKQLYSFKHPPDAYLPIGTLILDKDGNLYGVTANGGAGYGENGGGTVFELVRSGHAWRHLDREHSLLLPGRSRRSRSVFRRHP